MLEDEAEHEAVPKQAVRRIELRPLQDLERQLPDLAEIRARRRRVEQLERRPLLASMLERVVDVVAGREDRIAAREPPEQPELLEMADVGEVPDERRLQRGMLADEIVVGEQLEQPQRPAAGGCQLAGYPLLRPDRHLHGGKV